MRFCKGGGRCGSVCNERQFVLRGVGRGAYDSDGGIKVDGFQG